MLPGNLKLPRYILLAKRACANHDVELMQVAADDAEESGDLKSAGIFRSIAMHWLHNNTSYFEELFVEYFSKSHFQKWEMKLFLEAPRTASSRCVAADDAEEYGVIETANGYRTMALLQRIMQ